VSASWVQNFKKKNERDITKYVSNKDIATFQETVKGCSVVSEARRL
jgi:hypothetical protein